MAAFDIAPKGGKFLSQGKTSTIPDDGNRPLQPVPVGHLPGARISSADGRLPKEQKAAPLRPTRDVTRPR